MHLFKKVYNLDPMAPRARRLANNPGRSAGSKSRRHLAPKPSPHAIERETREYAAATRSSGDAFAHVFEDRHRVVVERRRRGASSRIQWSASHVDGVVVV